MLALAWLVMAVGCKPSPPGPDDARRWYSQQEEALERLDRRVQSALEALPPEDAVSVDCVPWQDRTEIPEPLRKVVAASECEEALSRAQDEARDAALRFRAAGFERLVTAAVPESILINASADRSKEGQEHIESLGHVGTEPLPVGEHTVWAADGLEHGLGRIGWGGYGLGGTDAEAVRGFEVAWAVPQDTAQVSLRVFLRVGE